MTTIDELPKSILTKKQVKTFTHTGSNGYKIVAEVRYDDECGNGHNSFGITATIYEYGRDVGRGCCHEEVAKHFPGLAPLIKWHLVSSDGPMHYIANTLYHAGDRDHNGRRKGERYHVKGHEEKRIVFGDFPISFEVEDRFAKFLETVSRWQDAEVVPVEHPPETQTNYKFSPKWTIKGFDCEWYQCPFDRKEEAKDFVKACQLFTPKIVVFAEKFTKIGEGKTRELDHARSSAVWPEATDKQLCQEPDALKAALLVRLPGLMLEFKAAVESLGFTY